MYIYFLAHDMFYFRILNIGILACVQQIIDEITFLF